MGILRGPGGNEPLLILERMKAGKSFEEALAEVERLDDFKCEKWWIDLNRPLFIEQVKAPAKKPEK